MLFVILQESTTFSLWKFKMSANLQLAELPDLFM